MKKPKRLWLSANATSCDICTDPILLTFIDGATVFGPWANMCPTCHARYGRGLGPGLGQQYERQSNGSYATTT